MYYMFSLCLAMSRLFSLGFSVTAHPPLYSLFWRGSVLCDSFLPFFPLFFSMFSNFFFLWVGPHWQGGPDMCPQCPLIIYFGPELSYPANTRRKKKNFNAFGQLVGFFYRSRNVFLTSGVCWVWGWGGGPLLNSLFVLIYSYQGAPLTTSLQCFFCYLMKVEPFLSQIIVD